MVANGHFYIVGLDNEVSHCRVVTFAIKLQSMLI
jgi:hypothetical protein